MLTGWLNSIRLTSNHIIGNNVYSRIFIQTRDYAARKGTREKAKQKKIKINLEKAGQAAQKRRQRKLKATPSPFLLMNERSLKPTTDDVWIIKDHPQPVYSLKQAIECHRETHHPTMFNAPDALVNAFIELNMKIQGKNKCIDKFTSLIHIPHPFETNKKKVSILALAKSTEQQNKAVTAGAEHVGGVEVIKQIQGGKFEFREYDYIVAHTGILTELLLIRGLLKRKFPNIKAGTLGTELGILVTKFKHVITCSASTPDENHKDYAQIDVPFGKLNMSMQKLEENFADVIETINKVGAARAESFIKRVQLKSIPSEELLKVNFNEYLRNECKEDTEEEPDDSAVIETQ